MTLDAPLIQLWGGPCDGETRRFDPATQPSAFYAVPGFGEHEQHWHTTKHWYQYDPIRNKAAFIGVTTEQSNDLWKDPSA